MTAFLPRLGAMVLLASGSLACSGSDLVITDDPSQDTGRAPDGTSSDGSGDGTTIDGGGDGVTSDASDGGGGDGIASDGSGDAISGDAIVVDAAGKPCTAGGSECDGSEFCDAPTCDKGSCKTRPTTVTPFAAACGCDGVTYYSAAYAASLGRSSRPDSGECPASTAASCGSFKGCPHTDDLCVRQSTGSTGCFTPGSFATCWSMSKDAPCSTSGKGIYALCGPGGGGCVGLCEAVKSGKTFYPACK